MAKEGGGVTPVDLAFLAVIVFVLIVFGVVIAKVIAKEARENREAGEAYDQQPSWPEILGRR